MVDSAGGETYFIVWPEEVESEDGDQLKWEREDPGGGARKMWVTYGNSGHGSDLESDGLWGEGPLVRVFEDDIWDTGHGCGRKEGMRVR